MPSQNEKIGSVVQKGILLLSRFVPFPAGAIVAAVSAAAVTKILDSRERKITDILSRELGLSHISYVNPDTSELISFYSKNPFYPALAIEFESEIKNSDYSTLKRYYPYLYGALILKRQIPALLFQKEMEAGQFKALAVKYEELSRGFSGIEGNAETEIVISDLARDFIDILSGVYESIKKEIKWKDEVITGFIDSVRAAANI